MSNHSGKLYVVATPIGNLADFSARGIAVLTRADLIAAEDTRHVRMLLNHYGISNKLVSLHQHNEQKASRALLEKLQQGLSIALVSDAGTPLLSDPGMPLVRMAREAGIEVSPVPGACALIAALSAAGLPVSRFLFEGFLPRSGAARRAFFLERRDWQLTWVFYESSHRILAAVEDMATVLPLQRNIVIAREMTKVHETIVKDTLEKVLDLLRQDENMRKGEFVVIVSAARPEQNKAAISAEQQKILTILLRECSTRSAAALAEEITGARKKDLYQAALALRDEQ